MRFTRRDFLKASGVSAAALSLGGCSFTANVEKQTKPEYELYDYAGGDVETVNLGASRDIYPRPEKPKRSFGPDAC